MVELELSDFPTIGRVKLVFADGHVPLGCQEVVDILELDFMFASVIDDPREGLPQRP
jgi:hypothetical protein